MVQFLPHDPKDTDSLDIILQQVVSPRSIPGSHVAESLMPCVSLAPDEQVDNALQYHDDIEPRMPDDELSDNEPIDD